MGIKTENQVKWYLLLHSTVAQRLTPVGGVFCSNQHCIGSGPATTQVLPVGENLAQEANLKIPFATATAVVKVFALSIYFTTMCHHQLFGGSDSSTYHLIFEI